MFPAMRCVSQNGRYKHCSVDEGRNAADEQAYPHNEDNDRPRRAEALVERTLQHVAQLHRTQSKNSVREDDAPVVDVELGQFVSAAGDGKYRHHDPREPHTPHYVRECETDG